MFFLIRWYCLFINYLFPKHNKTKPIVNQFNDTFLVEDNDGFIKIVPKATPCNFRFLNVCIIIGDEDYVLYLNKYFLDGNEWNREFFAFILYEQHKIYANAFLIVICDHEYKMNHIHSEQLNCIKLGRSSYKVLLLP
jgi:hypothetical protein